MATELEEKIAWLRKENDALVSKNTQLMELLERREAYQKELEKACETNLRMKLACMRVYNLMVETSNHITQKLVEEFGEALALGDSSGNTR